MREELRSRRWCSWARAPEWVAETGGADESARSDGDEVGEPRERCAIRYCDHHLMLNYELKNGGCERDGENEDGGGDVGCDSDDDENPR